MSQEFKDKLRTSTREKIRRFNALRGEFHIDCPLSLPRVCWTGLRWLVLTKYLQNLHFLSERHRHFSNNRIYGFVCSLTLVHSTIDDVLHTLDSKLFPTSPTSIAIECHSNTLVVTPVFQVRSVAPSCTLLGCVIVNIHHLLILLSLQSDKVFTEL